ncbi:MbtH family protein [Streptomyces cucumeris]|uniref:MbtH family protein n=1 Tax=Streptomyces TaxID=1883 RepID=UPI0020C8E9A7|nr:MbtH family NRPS accessory protein [Streptomyces sp. NEAU-Y11]MCP9206642.1 MbtH family NRPS accessory protein [Streptomyces sp. NEAU-Y11]
MRNEQGDGPYRVVVNHDDQYSLWPADRENAPGWHDEGTTGDRATCLRRIEDIWTDMRPASLRERMDGPAREEAGGR